MDFGIAAAIELIIFHLCYKTKWFPEGGVNSQASTLEKLLPARNCFFPRQRNSTIPDLWFQVGLFFFHVHHSAFPQVHLNLQHNLAMTWFSCHWCPFDADCANHVVFFSKIEEKYGFYFLKVFFLLVSHCAGYPELLCEARNENNFFSHMLGTCSPFWIPEVVPKPFPLRVLTPHHCSAVISVISELWTLPRIRRMVV